MKTKRKKIKKNITRKQNSIKPSLKKLKIGKDAFYNYMIKHVSNKKTPYLPPELQRAVKGYL